jgi:hypothetical protein
MDCAKYTENAGELQIEQILQEKTDNSVLHAVASDETIHRKYRHIVVKIDRANKTNRKEYDIGERMYRNRVPGFMRYICIFPCYDTNPHAISGRICQAEPIEKNRKDVLVMPYLSEGSIEQYSWDESKLPILKCVLMQTVMSTLVAYTNLRFIHVDLHLGNILIRKTKKKEINYVIGKNQYSIPTLGYKIMIADFGNSMLPVQDKDQRYYWFDLLNVFSRINLDLQPSNGRKMVWNDEPVIDFVKRARDTNAPPHQATQLLRIIHQTTFRFDTMPTTTYNPNVFG